MRDARNEHYHFLPSEEESKSKRPWKKNVQVPPSKLRPMNISFALHIMKKDIISSYANEVQKKKK